jgi:hypothetical protein
METILLISVLSLLVLLFILHTELSNTKRCLEQMHTDIYKRFRDSSEPISQISLLELRLQKIERGETE